MRAVQRNVLTSVVLMVAAVVVLSRGPGRAELSLASEPGALLTFHNRSNQMYRCSGEQIGENTWLTARHCVTKRDGRLSVTANGSTVVEHRAHFIARRAGEEGPERVRTDVAVIGDLRDVSLEVGDLTQRANRGENGLLVVRAWQDDENWHECRTRLRNAEYINGNWAVQCWLKPGASGAVVWYVADADAYLKARGAKPELGSAVRAAGFEDGSTWRQPGMLAVGVLSTASTSGWNSISEMKVLLSLLGQTDQ